MGTLNGLVPAVITPMDDTGSLNLDMVEPMVEHLVTDDVHGIYVCGSTGEGPSLTTDERKEVVREYNKAANGTLDVIAHVGHNSLRSAKELASHAKAVGVDAIAAVPPSYYGRLSEETITRCIKEITKEAPGLPFYYYHVPVLNSMEISIHSLLKKVDKTVSEFEGVKFSSRKIAELQEVLDFKEKKYSFLFGVDQMLLSALSVGADAAVGSTYNFAAPLYQKIIRNYETGNLSQARKYQLKSIEMVRVFQEFRGHPAFKAAMKLIGLDCGPARLPLRALTQSELEEMESALRDIGFFEWAR